MPTIYQLASRKRKLEEQLAEVNEEINKRAGQTDQAEPVKKVAAKKATAGK